MPQDLAVDATCMISALLGGRAREIIFSGRFALQSPQATLFEVAKHLSWLAGKVGEAEETIYQQYRLLPVVACQPSEYAAAVLRATELIGGRDALDVPLLALAFAKNCPVWSDDRDFEGIAGVEVLTTAEILRRIAVE